MATVRAQVEIESNSALPEDRIVNRWHFNTFSTPASAADLTLIRDALQAFYQGHSAYRSRQYNRSASVTFYDVNDPEPRVPILTLPLDTGVIVPERSLPAEAAVVLSFQGELQSGVSQARRRNRVYLGPWNTNALGDGGLAEQRVASALVLVLRARAQDLLDASDAAVTWAWIVRSETTGAFTLVDNGWIDNAWDTQRRRGRDADGRSTFSLA